MNNNINQKISEKLKHKFIISIGNKARQGKDLLASYLEQQLKPQVYVTHWADLLKEQVSNKERTLPLIYRKYIDNVYCYYLLQDTHPHPIYTIKIESDVPYLHKLFTKRNLEVYKGMDEKDSEMLQFWGTDFRRMMYNKDYWVNLTLEHISHRPEKYIIIPDTRFINEFQAVKNLNGIYVHVVRLNNDGSRFLDTSRDSKHVSETQLDDITADFTISAKSGDIEDFNKQANQLFQLIINKGE